MTLTFNKLSKTPKMFSNLTELNIEQFKFLFNSISNEITLYSQSKFKTTADLLLSYLMYFESKYLLYILRIFI